MEWNLEFISDHINIPLNFYRSVQKYHVRISLYLSLTISSLLYLSILKSLTSSDVFIYNVRLSSNFEVTSKLAERSYLLCAIVRISKDRRKAKKQRASHSFLLLSNFLIRLSGWGRRARGDVQILIDISTRTSANRYRSCRGSMHVALQWRNI